MRRLIYDMYYANEIDVDVAIRLIDKLNYYLDRKKY